MGPPPLPRSKNRALEDNVAVLRRAGESAAATAAGAADEVELLRRQVIIAESQIKQLEAAVGTRWRKMFDFLFVFLLHVPVYRPLHSILP